VFVHGLGGHPVKTWSTENAYWPKDLLGPDVPHVRILTFGYDAKVAKALGRVGQNNIHDHAQALVSDLRRQRKKEAEVAIINNAKWEGSLTNWLESTTSDLHGA